MQKSISESAVRRQAKRRGWMLIKFRGRNPDVHRYGIFKLSDVQTDGLVLMNDELNSYGCDLEKCAEYIS